MFIVYSLRVCVLSCSVYYSPGWVRKNVALVADGTKLTEAVQRSAVIVELWVVSGLILAMVSFVSSLACVLFLVRRIETPV